MNAWEAFYGPNVGYALELYESYLRDPDSVDEATRAFFEQIGPVRDGESAVATLARPLTTVSGHTNGKTTTTSLAEVAPAGSVARREAPSAAPPQKRLDKDTVGKVVLAARMARSIREYGHLDARIDPLGGPRPSDPMLNPATHGITDADLEALPASIVWPAATSGTSRDAIRELCAIYCGSIGYEFDHVQDYEERVWLHSNVEAGSFRAPLSPAQRGGLLRRLTEVEGFERFLHTVYQGQKRFSIEGNDTLIPVLDELVDRAAEAGMGEVLIGMAHRGRLNVLAHVLNKPYATIFGEFHTAAKRDHAPISRPVNDEGWTGDVKYHLGWRRPLEGKNLQITLADNPSHLEFVDPVVEGFARAAQDRRDQPGAPEQDVDRAFPILIHGDAAFPGEGVVAETLNLSRLPGYETGGTIHLVVNNQIGFTTETQAGRSTLYASDLAKGFEIPIVHVNADDPEACVHMVRLAFAYRERFHKDFLIDLVGYRRWGHNEGDEPAFTQPRMYSTIAEHPTVRALYAQQLEREGVLPREEADALVKEIQEILRRARDEEEARLESEDGAAHAEIRLIPRAEVPVTSETLREMNDALLSRPAGFTPNPKLERLLLRRREALERERGIDWAHAETLAFASILADGTPIRLSGQDTERGTFSQRHLILHDPETGAEFVPLQALPQARASFAVYNSPLSEAAVMGFEYGYSGHAPEALVLWEAQFGDFANAGQVLIDQFISSARAKWGRVPALGLLLPHGYEGQGPEHSSARLERFLQLAAEGNMRIVNLTSAGQYFHVLRLQAAELHGNRRPLVVMTPKSLLRHPRASSSLNDLAGGRFQAVLDDAAAAEHADRVRRLILCSGKVAIDLETSTRDEPVDWIAVARVEQLYPFPQQELECILERYSNLDEAVWLQEEPQNMGAWAYIAPRLRTILPAGVPLRYIGRPERAATAEGSPDTHQWEQARIVDAAFAGERAVRIETQGVQRVD